ncbi:MAG: sigma-70 family RNA polymerase sigma factor [Actinomycetota bacterium]
MPDDREARFERLFRSQADVVRSYALRRADPEDADDVVAETFLVAWRRFDDMPADPRPWLLGVARHVLANRRRADRRVVSLSARLAQGVAVGSGAHTDGTAAGTELRLAVISALEHLPDKEREAMRLLAWDRLSPADAATMLGCSRATLAVRAHRARRKLAMLLDQEGDRARAAPAPPSRPIRIAKEQ